MGVYWAGAESSTNVANVSLPGGNGGSTSTEDQYEQAAYGNGSSIENKGTGTTGHKLLDQLNELKAKGMGGTTQAKELERYLHGVETKYQSQGESLYGDVSTLEGFHHGTPAEKKRLQNIALRK